MIIKMQSNYKDIREEHNITIDFNKKRYQRESGYVADLSHHYSFVYFYKNWDILMSVDMKGSL